MNKKNVLTPEENEVLIKCFSIGFGMGATNPLTCFSFCEEFILNPYIHPSGYNPETEMTMLVQGMIKFLRSTYPMYEYLETPEDFFEALNTIKF